MVVRAARLLLPAGSLRGGVMDFAEEARRHRDMAEECRTKASSMKDEGIRAQYRRLAEDFDQLATHEARVAANMRKSK